jgi:hypothetical protein
MESSQDPRRTITPDAFSVAPGLLGIPLASPWRRLAAMLIDLVLIGLLANARAVFFALAAAAFLFWMAIRGRKDSRTGAARMGLGCLASGFAFIAVLVIWGPMFVPDDAVLFEAEGPGGAPVPVSVGAIGDLLSLVTESDTANLEGVAARLVERYRASGMDRDQMLAVVEAIRDDNPDNAELADLLRAAIGFEQERAGGAPEGEGPSFAERLSAYASAVAAGDSAAIDSLRPPVARIVATPELAERDRRLASLGAENAELEEDLQEARSNLEAEQEKGLRRTVTNLFDEFGLGLGWSGLYFTFLTGFFRGRTPGKRVMGIRIVRLDGRPLGYWASFERFGGYAASLFTGFEGFLRILWDPNRQGLEDKLAETVVVVDSAETRGQLERVAMWGPTGAPPQG